MAHGANRFGFGRFVTRSQLEHTILQMTRNPPGVQARGNPAMCEWDATAALRTIGVPVLVIGGERVPAYPPGAGYIRAEADPRCEFTV